MFLFENVRGLLTHDNGKTFKVICKIFKDQGYTLEYKVLNAWDYKVPQKRERQIIIGVRNYLKDGINLKFQEPFDDKLVLKDVLLDVNPPKSECMYHSKSKADVFKSVPPGGYWRDIDTQIAKNYTRSSWHSGGGRTGILRRLSLDEPSLTV